jgi:hypothetical protein
MTKLDQLRTIEQVARRVDEAINRFLPGPGRIEQFDDFVTYIIRFCRLVEATVLGLRDGAPKASRDFDRGRFAHVFSAAYGDRELKTAFEIARTGNEGGLYAVLRKLGEVIAGQYAENEIAARIWSYWNGLSLAEKLAAPDEYLRKYGHLLPSEITEGCAGRVRANMPKVLQEHPRLMRRLRRVGA